MKQLTKMLACLLALVMMASALPVIAFAHSDDSVVASLNEDMLYDRHTISFADVAPGIMLLEDDSFAQNQQNVDATIDYVKRLTFMRWDMVVLKMLASNNLVNFEKTIQVY